jgi:hypothetical protein
MKSEGIIELARSISAVNSGSVRRSSLQNEDNVEAKVAISCVGRFAKQGYTAPTKIDIDN